MMTKFTADEILAPKPESRLRIYAWSPVEPTSQYLGLIKIGQTHQENVNERIKQSQGQMQHKYILHVDELAERNDGTIFRDAEVRQRLIEKGFENVIIGSSREWMRCDIADVKTAITELQNGIKLSGTHHETFAMRAEQETAVEFTLSYFKSRWKEDRTAVPRFLWNAKMRFGKTFTSYQLASQMKATRILVVTFKPAVEDAWKSDLENHADFEGWQYLSKSANSDPSQIDPKKPVVYFGSFQDLLGKDRETGAIMA